MTESFWESQTAVEAQPEFEPELEMAVVEERPETGLNPQDEEPEAANPRALSVSLDDFSALEEKIVRAVALVKKEREARGDAEERAAAAEALMNEQAPVVDKLQIEIASLKAERDHVRQRVERLISQLDALEV